MYLNDILAFIVLNWIKNKSRSGQGYFYRKEN